MSKLQYSRVVDTNKKRYFEAPRILKEKKSNEKDMTKFVNLTRGTPCVEKESFEAKYRPSSMILLPFLQTWHYFTVYLHRLNLPKYPSPECHVRKPGPTQPQPHRQLDQLGTTSYVSSFYLSFFLYKPCLKLPSLSFSLLLSAFSFIFMLFWIQILF